MASERALPELRSCYPCRGADEVAARACEEAVFGRRFGNTAEELAAEYGPYEATTSFGAVLRPDGTAVGAVRLVAPGARGLKTLVDAAGPPWRVPDDVLAAVAGGAVGPEGPAAPLTWDVATFGVDSVAAGGDRRIAAALFGVMFGAFADHGVTCFVAMLDSGARRAIERLGVRLLDLPGAQAAPYLGSASTVPAYRQVADLHDEHRTRFPDLHDPVFHGRGLPGVVGRPVAQTVGAVA